MNARLIAVATKRARLIERAAQERADVERTLQLWSRPLGFVDRCVAAVAFVVARPPLLAGAAVLFALLQPRRVFRWARRALGFWQTYRWLTKKIAI